jgi:hypothetical protein
MILHSITLPTTDNDGRSTESALRAWQSIAVALAGGYTRGSPETGAWLGSDNRLYSDISVTYRVACDHETIWRKLVAKAFELFPDQLAICHAVIGTAEIENRLATSAYEAAE